MGRYDWEEKQRARDAARSRSGTATDWSTTILIALLIGVLILGAYWALFSPADNAIPIGEKITASALQAQSRPPANALGTTPTTPAQLDQSSPVASARPGKSVASQHFDHCGLVRITCVVDGDTIWLDRVKIRIADINAPEVSAPQCASEKILADRATDRLIALLNTGPFEISPIGNRDEDQYGRKLRVLSRSGRSLGDQLVTEGLAKTWVGHREPWC